MLAHGEKIQDSARRDEVEARVACSCHDAAAALDGIHNKHHAPLAILKLAAYASDAMRVLSALEQQADVSASFDETLRAHCPTWRNPGAASSGPEVIAEAIWYAAQDVQALFEDVLKVADQVHGLRRKKVVVGPR